MSHQDHQSGLFLWHFYIQILSDNLWILWCLFKNADCNIFGLWVETIKSSIISLYRVIFKIIYHVFYFYGRKKRAHLINRHSLAGKINYHKDRLSFDSFMINWSKIRPHWDFISHSFTWQKSKNENLTIRNIREVSDDWDLLVFHNERANWYNALVTIQHSIWPNNYTLVFHGSHYLAARYQKTCTRMFTTALFITTKLRNKLGVHRCANGWIKMSMSSHQWTALLHFSQQKSVAVLPPLQAGICFDKQNETEKMLCYFHRASKALNTSLFTLLDPREIM